jgi:ribulose-bisphosphate carboxylase large chain
MPVFSSGQWAGQAFDTYQQLGSADLMYLCGGGIIGHPGGIASGIRSVRRAWEAALEGVPLPDAARTSTELRQAVEQFGR